MFILYIIFPIALIIYIIKKNNFSRSCFFLSIALFYKITSSFSMTYAQINFYNFGDLYQYYAVAKKISNTSFDASLIITFSQNQSAIAVLNSFIFRIFPASIYGLSVIAGCASFIYCYLIVKTIEKSFIISRFTKFLIFFLPALSLQSGYIGKETYILPLIGLILYAVADGAYKHRLLLLISILIIGYIRLYQIFFILIPLITCSIYGKYIKIKLLVGIALLCFLTYLANEFFVELSGFGMEDIDLSILLNTIYSDGNLILEPYVFPLSILQSFRPFTWEANSVQSFLSSIECEFVLIYFLYTGYRKFTQKSFNYNEQQLRIYRFISISIFLYLILFAFNSNMGDLSRRHVYYYPLILVVFCKPKQ